VSARRSVEREERESGQGGRGTRPTPIARGTGIRAKGLFEVKPGTVHLVLGERDSGKTALLETLAGIRKEESGPIAVGDDPQATPRERRRHVRFVPHDRDPSQLTVLTRLTLARPPRRFGLFLDTKEARARAEALASRVGLAGLLDVPVDSLRPLERRLLEVAAALDGAPSAILLDEPTSDLGPHEARQLMRALHTIAREDSIAVVVSTTWPRDAYPDARAVTILRRGEEPVTVATEEVTEAALLERWTGGVPRRTPTGPHAPGETLLRIEDVVLPGRGRETSLAGIGFEVKAGEVLAIVGAPADGLGLLHEMLLSRRAPERGSIHFLGKEMARTGRRQRVDAGMSFVNPPHARDQSLPGFSVEENLAFGQTRRAPFSRHGWLKFDSIRGNAVRSLADFEVPDAKPRDRFGRLSLGARQRIVVAREVLRNPVLLVVRSPAQGLGLESQEYVRKTLVLQCERGSGLLWLTEDPEEALRVADRLAVLALGRLIWMPVTETLTREAIVDEMSGSAA
jgi:ABC-type uncharacterized transport system ATPase subunit